MAFFQRTIRLLFLSSLLVAVISCEEVINPDLPSVDPIIVIDGWISSLPGRSHVKLSYSQPFNSQDPFTTIPNAEVRVTREGEAYVFKETLPGEYLPPNNFMGIPERNYELQVTIENVVFRATAFMPATPNVTAIDFSFFEETNALDEGHYPTLDFELNPSVPEYFFWETFINNKKADPDLLNLLNDEDFNNSIPVNGYLFYDTPINPTFDTVQVVFSSLSSPAFRYYEGLQLLTEVGSPSQSVPQNPPSNIEGNALGYFNCSATIVLTKLPE